LGSPGAGPPATIAVVGVGTAVAAGAAGSAAPPAIAGAAGAGSCAGAVVGVGAKSGSVELQALATNIPVATMLSIANGRLLNHLLIITTPP